MILVAVSGGFDPLHAGHVRLIEAARRLGGDRLVVILNNDAWLLAKKGYVFQTQSDRMDILLALKGVDVVILTDHRPQDPDPSVSRALRSLRPDIFANGGDRTAANTVEVAVCEEIGCLAVFGIGGGKVQSSSALVAAVRGIHG